MAIKYLGFDLGSMLFWLQTYCEKVELHKDGDKWRLYVLSDDHGEYENTGTLSNVTINAFKPFVERAKKDRDSAMEKINNIVFT